MNDEPGGLVKGGATTATDGPVILSDDESEKLKIKAAELDL